jgi:hypothetical protein
MVPGAPVDGKAAVTERRDPRRVIAPVLETLQAVEEERRRLL